jgi:hypothetical protein
LTGSLAVSAAIVLAMIAVSGYGASVLPAHTRVPLHLGVASLSYWAPKRAALVIWPALGALVCGVVGAIMASNAAYGWSPAGRETLTPALMCILVTFQAGAIITARRTPAVSSAPQAGSLAGSSAPPAAAVTGADDDLVGARVSATAGSRAVGDLGRVSDAELAAGPLEEGSTSEPDDVRGGGAGTDADAVPGSGVPGDLPVDLDG